MTEMINMKKTEITDVVEMTSHNVTKNIDTFVTNNFIKTFLLSQKGDHK